MAGGGGGSISMWAASKLIQKQRPWKEKWSISILCVCFLPSFISKSRWYRRCLGDTNINVVNTYLIISRWHTIFIKETNCNAADIPCIYYTSTRSTNVLYHCIAQPLALHIDHINSTFGFLPWWLLITCYYITVWKLFARKWDNIFLSR